LNITFYCPKDKKDLAIISIEFFYFLFIGGSKITWKKGSKNFGIYTKDFKVPSRLGIFPGYVHLVRFIRSNRILDVFG